MDTIYFTRRRIFDYYCHPLKRSFHISKFSVHYQYCDTIFFQIQRIHGYQRFERKSTQHRNSISWPKLIVIATATRFVWERWTTWNYVRSAHSRAVAAHTRVVPSEYLSGRIATVCTRFWRMQKGISLP